MSRGSNASITSASPTWQIRTSWSASAPADTGVVASRHVHRSAHPGHHPGDLRLPARQGIDGPLYMGKDTHALSAPRSAPHSRCWRRTGSKPSSSENDGVTPTPVISRAILVYNRGRKEHLADGIVITPSHNPPEDGGFKYNPPNGGPADTDVTQLDSGSRQRTAAQGTMPA